MPQVVVEYRLGHILFVVETMKRLIYGHPRFCNSDLEGWMACTNLSGVVVRNSPRATMRIAPDGPYNSSSFWKLVNLPGCPSGRLAVHVIKYQQSQNLMGLTLNLQQYVRHAAVTDACRSNTVSWLTIAHATRASLLASAQATTLE